jgi:hypothetical protein
MEEAMRSEKRALIASLVLCVALAGPALAQKKYDTGASDTEIRIGNIMPYSGPASAYGTIGKALGAYFNKVNAEGGINGRKVTFITYDDGYAPPKTVEQARRLVENDDVLLILNSLGTAHNTAIQKYMNTKKVPQLFVATGATKFGDPKNFPWTMGWQPNYQSEGRIFAQYILPVWKDDPGMKDWVAFMDKYYPDGDKSSSFPVYGYSIARTMVQVLQQCGDDLTRANVMKQAANLKDYETGMALPGIKINTSPTDFYPIEQMQMGRFNGESFVPFGPILSGEIGGS